MNIPPIIRKNAFETLAERLREFEAARIEFNQAAKDFRSAENRLKRCEAAKEKCRAGYAEIYEFLKGEAPAMAFQTAPEDL